MADHRTKIPDQKQLDDHTQGTKKRAMIATVAIFGSRLLGLVREQIFAFFFGAGAVLDAFYVAFRIPNVLRDLAAEGALSQSFVTIFAQQLTTEGKEAAKALTRKTNAFILIVIGLIVILGVVFAPQLTYIIGYGFTKTPEKYNLTVRLLRILFPYVFFISLASLLMGVLNAHKKFFIPFSASTFGNFIAITFGLFLAWLCSHDYIGATFNKLMHGTPLKATDFLTASNAIMGMALGSLLAGLSQYLFQLPSAWRLGFKPNLDFRFKDNTFIKMLKLTGPAMVAGASVQINVLTNTFFASLLEDGSIAWLQFAFRLAQFPLGVFGVAIAAASAPVLAQMIAQRREKDFRESLRSSINLSLFLTIPSFVGLATLARPIISLIYEHGHVNAYQTTQTSYALITYSLGISFFALIKIYQPAYLAFHDARTPMKLAFLSIIINAVINATFIFIFKWGHWSLALGVSLIAFVNIILLTMLFKRKISHIWTRDLWWNTFKTLIAAFIMGIMVYYVTVYLKTRFPALTITNQILLVFLPVSAAIIIYFLTAWLLKVKDALFFVNKIFRLNCRR